LEPGVVEQYRNSIIDYLTRCLVLFNTSELVSLWSHIGSDDISNNGSHSSLIADLDHGNLGLMYNGEFPLDFGDKIWETIIMRIPHLADNQDPHYWGIDESWHFDTKSFLCELINEGIYQNSPPSSSPLQRKNYFQHYYETKPYPRYLPPSLQYQFDISSFTSRLLDISDRNNNTVFHILLKVGKIRVFNLLWKWITVHLPVAAYLPVVTSTNILGETLIHLLVTYPYENVITVINELAILFMQRDQLSRSAVFNLVSRRGNILHYACLTCHCSNVELVLQSNPQYNPDALMDGQFSYFELIARHPLRQDITFSRLLSYFNTVIDMCSNSGDDTQWLERDDNSDVYLDLDTELEGDDENNGIVSIGEEE
jgi:hypothetical protein